MKVRQFVAGLAAFVLSWLSGSTLAGAQEMQNKLVRMAELEIDPVMLTTYKAALTEEIEASLRLEPGVLNLFAVAHKDNPAHITILEVYADAAAYKAHLETPHFKKYKALTQSMIRSLKLAEVDSLIPGTTLPR